MWNDKLRKISKGKQTTNKHLSRDKETKMLNVKIFQRWDTEQESWEAANDMPEVRSSDFSPICHLLWDINELLCELPFVKKTVRAWFFAAALDTLLLPILLMIIILILNIPITDVLIKVRVRFCAAAVDTRFLAVIGGEMDGEVGRGYFSVVKIANNRKKTCKVENYWITFDLKSPGARLDEDSRPGNEWMEDAGFQNQLAFCFEKTCI